MTIASPNQHASEAEWRKDSHQLFVVTDHHGTILGATLQPTPDGVRLSAGFATLPGQTLQKVEIPEELLPLESAEELLRAVLKYHVPSGSARIERVEPSNAKS